MNSQEIRTQIEQLINEYALKLNAAEAQLSEKNEDLRLLKKSFVVLEEKLTPSEHLISELSARCKTYEITIRELEEQINDLSQLSGVSNARLTKLEHKNSSKFYAIILLSIISLVSLGLALNSGSSVVSKLSNSMSNKLSSSSSGASSKPSKQRKKRKASAVVVNNDSQDSEQASSVDNIKPAEQSSKDSSIEVTAPSVAN
jgi:hypothetical protein